MKSKNSLEMPKMTANMLKTGIAVICKNYVTAKMTVSQALKAITVIMMPSGQIDTKKIHLTEIKLASFSLSIWKIL